MDKASPFLKGHSELPRAPTRDTPSKVKIRDEAGKCWSDKSCLPGGKSEFVLTSVVLLGVCVSQAGTPRSEGQAPLVSIAGGGVSRSRTRLSNFTLTFHFHAWEKEMATHSRVLAWRIPGTGDLVGCHLWGHKESDTTEAT